MEDNGKIKKVIAFLCVLFGISIVAAGGMLLGQYISAAMPVFAGTEENLNSSESEAPPVTPGGDEGNFAVAAEGTERKRAALFRGQSSDKDTLEISGMKPGDRAYRAYELKVTYSGTLTVRFGVNVISDENIEGTSGGDPGAKLADALMVRVNIEGGTLYEGTLSKMPKEITYTITSPEKTVESLNYDIYAWLPSWAGSAYQNRRFEAELCWWVDESSAGNVSGAGRLEEIPDTGAPLSMAVFAAAAVSLAGMAVFGMGSKKKYAKK